MIITAFISYDEVASLFCEAARRTAWGTRTAATLACHRSTGWARQMVTQSQKADGKDNDNKPNAC